MGHQHHIRQSLSGAAALAAMACILLTLAATAGARPADNFVPQKATSPTSEAPTVVKETVVRPGDGPDAIVFVLIGLGTGLAVLGAGCMGARRATPATHARTTDVRVS
jgi:hypothetical protein